MQDLEWFDVLRVLTTMFALASLYISARRARRMWSDYTRRLRELVWSVQAFLVLMIEGSIEGIALNVPGGPRTILSFLISIAFLRAISREEGYLKSEGKS